MKSYLMTIKSCVVIAILAMMAVSCGKSSDLLDTIPQNSRMVFVTNPKDLAGKVDFDKMDMRQLPADVKEDITKFFKGDYGVDPEQLAIFEYDKKIYISMNVTDEAKFVSSLEGTQSTVDGITFISISDGVFAVKDGLCWCTESYVTTDVMAKDINIFLSIDPAKSVRSCPAFDDNMKGGDFCGYINSGMLVSEALANCGDIEKFRKAIPYIDDMTTTAAYIRGTSSKSELKLTAKIFDKEGKNFLKKLDMPDFDTDLLKFLDSKASMAYGLKVDESFLKAIKDELMATMRGAMEKGAATIIFNNIEGDFAVGVTMTDVRDMSRNGYTFVAKLKDDADKSLREIIEKQLGLKADVNGEYVIDNAYGRMPVRFGFKDDCFYATNSVLPQNSYKGTSAASYFDDKCFVSYIDFTEGSYLSSLGTVFTGKKFDGFARASVNDEQAEIVLHVNNNEDNNIYSYIYKLVK